MGHAFNTIDIKKSTCRMSNMLYYFLEHFSNSLQLLTVHKLTKSPYCLTTKLIKLSKTFLSKQSTKYEICDIKQLTRVCKQSKCNYDKYSAASM